MKHFQSCRLLFVLEWVVFAVLLWVAVAPWRLVSVRHVLFPSCVVADDVSVVQTRQSINLTTSFSWDTQYIYHYIIFCRCSKKVKGYCCSLFWTSKAYKQLKSVSHNKSDYIKIINILIDLLATLHYLHSKIFVLQLSSCLENPSEATVANRLYWVKVF